MRRERWIVSHVPRELVHGGTLRAHHLYQDLIRRTGAVVVPHGGGRALLRLLLTHPPYAGARLAATEFIPMAGWRVVRRLVRPALHDFHDHPLLWGEALGIPQTAATQRRWRTMLSTQLPAFERVIVQTEAFGDLCDVPAERRIVISNGTDTEHIHEAPIPADPVVGYVGGAHPGRGIEALIEGARVARDAVPELRLRLALYPSDPYSAGYLEQLRTATAPDPWITIERVPYAGVPIFMAACALMAVPHGPHPYMDVHLPIKLFDAFAAGRPVVATPRTEIARVIRECEAGEVARSDDADDLGAAIVALFADWARLRARGRRARACAVARFDWRILSKQLADAVLGADA